MLKKGLLLSAILLSGTSLMSEVVPATVFNHNMVLQRDAKVPVWGKAESGERVTVSFAGQELSSTAGSDGKWMVTLAPMAASKENRPLIIRGEKNQVTINNCLVGDVWLCSGQSNMQMPMWTRNSWRVINGDQDVKNGVNPLIRIVQMHRAISPVAQDDIPIKWEMLNAKNGMGLSAAAFYFGQELFRALDVPIALVTSHWGGSMIEPWTPPVGFEGIPQLKQLSMSVNARIPGTPEYKAVTAATSEAFARWMSSFNAAVAAGKNVPPPPEYPAELRPFSNRSQPTVMYNHMIHPLIPFRLRGVIWYQGCSNLHDGALYRYKMQAWLNGWRKVFNDDKLPVYIVQLAPYRYNGGPYRLPVIWEAQAAFVRDNKNVGMAVINDVGDFKDIHPRDKRTVGQRLALLALRHTYSKAVKADSPELSSWKIEGGKFILKFKNVEKWQGTPDHFEVSGAAGIWEPAKVTFSGTDLIVYSDKITEPHKMRYLWHHTKAGVLFNEAKLPLGAFRCGKNSTKEDILNDVFRTSSLIYHHNMLAPTDPRGSIKYPIDNSKAVKGKVKRITYVIELVTADGKEQWAVISMDSFTPDVAKIGVPVHATGVRLGCNVKNMRVFSNVPGIVTGDIAQGRIEFWGCSYIAANNSRVPGASATCYDWGDTMVRPNAVGYGSMQIHNIAARQVIFAYNNFRNRNCDIGLGNAPGKHPDWTFSANRRNYSKAVLRVFAETE